MGGLIALFFTHSCGGWRPLRAAALPAISRALYNRALLRALSRRLAAAEAAALPAISRALYNRAFLRVLSRRLAAAEGSGPPSYFSRNTLARVAYSQLFFKHTQTRIIVMYVVILLYG